MLHNQKKDGSFDMMGRLRIIAVLCLEISLGIAANPARAASEKIIYAASKAPNDCMLPNQKVLRIGGKFYGTCGSGGTGRGVVYSLTSAGHFQLLHAFAGGEDGAYPDQNMTELNGILYGITLSGGIVGQYGIGTVFSITLSTGAYTQVHVFSQAEGQPTGSLLPMNGILYGVVGGGSSGFGSVYTLTPDNQFATIYSFHGSDGFLPIGGLTAIDGVLFGVSMYGGKGYEPPGGSGGKHGKHGNGLVFSLTAGGLETVLHEFHASPTDGVRPNGDLLALGNMLYGTTIGGGVNDRGTAYKVKPTGLGYKRLYDFVQVNTSPFVNPGLIALHGSIYGTTQGGGAHGYGSVFSLTHSGTEATVWSFQGGTDGETPAYGLTASNGKLYGATGSGGGKTPTCSEGCGTIFAITP